MVRQRIFSITREFPYLCNIAVQRQRVGDTEDEDDDDGSSIRQQPKERHVLERREHCREDVRNRITNDYAKSKHPPESAE